MPVPDYQTLMLPVLRIAAEGETRAGDVEEQIATQLNLTAQERGQLLPSGRQRLLNNRIQWAKFYMGKAGLIASPRRGWFLASEAGRALLASNPTRIDVHRLLEYPSFKEWYEASQAGSTAPESGPETSVGAPPAAHESTPEDQIETAYALVQSTLRAEPASAPVSGSSTSTMPPSNARRS